MKEYLSRFVGKKIGLMRAGIMKEVSLTGILKEIVGDAAVLITEDGHELGIPLSMIVMVGPADQGKEGRSAGFLGDK